jgi:hypothetical protein
MVVMVVPWSLRVNRAGQGGDLSGSLIKEIMEETMDHGDNREGDHG